MKVLITKLDWVKNDKDNLVYNSQTVDLETSYKQDGIIVRDKECDTRTFFCTFRNYDRKRACIVCPYDCWNPIGMEELMEYELDFDFDNPIQYTKVTKTLDEKLRGININSDTLYFELTSIFEEIANASKHISS